LSKNTPCKKAIIVVAFPTPEVNANMKKNCTKYEYPNKNHVLRFLICLGAVE
jgi:hypothetical protein